VILTKESANYISLDEPKSFELLHPRSVDEALGLYTEERDGAYLAGGCDLLDQLKNQWNNPRRVINLKEIAGLRGREDANGLLRLGALTTLAELEHDAAIRQRYRALSLAASRVATPQIRNAGTLGGNLLQDGRCPYYRGPWRCYRAGGIVCDAHHGINTEHAIFGGDRCYIVSSSDTATALTALDASVVIRGRDGERRIPVQELFMSPSQDILHMHQLHDGRILTAIELPGGVARRSHFIKYTMRNAWDFALASIAVAYNPGAHPTGWRIVLGGVAATPWRLPKVERMLEGAALDDATIGAAARAAIEGAEPLAHNAYKVGLVQKLVEQALRESAS
jgi:xanthine dehydrogenase YagS FAD-binding subunit